jgi:hypothetical protein
MVIEKIQKIESRIGATADRIGSKIKSVTESGLKKLPKVVKTYTPGIKPLKHRKILKKTKATVNIPAYKSPSVLGDTNRFFKSEFNQTKRGMFLE